MKKNMHVVLGGSGAIGAAVIAALQARHLPVRAVERSRAIEGVQTIRADLLDASQTATAIRGASHVYLCIGLPYRAAIWQHDWPRIMKHVIDACIASKAKLIFFDNVYMYGPAPLATPFNEEHPQRPTSSKGRTRQQIANQLLETLASGRLQGLIARSADFYGPNAVNSSLYIKFLENMLMHKRPQFLGKPHMPHTYAYTLDNGKAMVQLALDDTAYGQVWHLPVEQKPITIDEVAAIMNGELGTNYAISFLPRPLLGLISLITPGVKDAREMLYQFDNPYILSDAKFRKKYPDFQVTPYRDGIAAMVQSFAGMTTRKSNL